MTQFAFLIPFLLVTFLAAEPVCEKCATEPQPVQVGGLVKGTWIEGKDRKPVFSAESIFEDHEGRKVDLHQPGIPLIVSFIYTRCENERKCPRMTAHLGGLGKKMVTSDFARKAGVVLMTYDPKFDQPKVLAEYGKRNHFFIAKSNNTCRLVRCGNENFKELFKKWQLTVNFDRRDEVNIHGNQILVIDGQGRLARRYEILLPTHEQLLDDLKTLGTEAAGKK